MSWLSLSSLQRGSPWVSEHDRRRGRDGGANFLSFLVESRVSIANDALKVGGLEIGID